MLKTPKLIGKFGAEPLAREQPSLDFINNAKKFLTGTFNRIPLNMHWHVVSHYMQLTPLPPTVCSLLCYSVIGKRREPLANVRKLQ